MMEELAGLEDLNFSGYNDEVLCFLVKDESTGRILGGRHKTFMEAAAVVRQYANRRCIVIIKVIKRAGKREFIKVQG